MSPLKGPGLSIRVDLCQLGTRTGDVDSVVVAGAAEHSERDDGETSVEGLPTSTLRSLSGKLTFIPAGHDCFGWQDPRVLMRISYFYVDPQALPLDEELRFSEIEFKPRLFFFDAEL